MQPAGKLFKMSSPDWIAQQEKLLQRSKNPNNIKILTTCTNSSIPISSSDLQKNPLLQTNLFTRHGLIYARLAQAFAQLPQNKEYATIDLMELEDIGSSDLELCLSIFLLTQKYYKKYSNNLNRIKATIQIVMELGVASHKKTLNIICWNAISVKNKTDKQIPFRP